MLLAVLLIALRAVSATRPAVDLSLHWPVQEQEQIPRIIHQIWPQVPLLYEVLVLVCRCSSAGQAKLLETHLGI